MVRQRSAKPLSIGSIPIAASIYSKERTLCACQLELSDEAGSSKVQGFTHAASITSTGIVKPIQCQYNRAAV